MNTTQYVLISQKRIPHDRVSFFVGYEDRIVDMQ